MRSRPLKKLKLSKPSISPEVFAKSVEEKPLADSSESALFRASKTLGVVTDSIAVSVKRQGSEHFVTASAGNSFLVYDTENLQVSYMSPPLSAPIAAIMSIGEGTITACGESIQIWNKMVPLASLEGHSSTVRFLSTVGDSLLLSVSDSECLVWELPRIDRSTKPLAGKLMPETRFSTNFHVTAVTAVPTYLNKMLIGGSSGELQLWNIRSGKMLFDFKKILCASGSISAVEASPALDVVAVGTSGGQISMLNLKSGEVLFKLDQSLQGSVTSLTFREGMLVAGSSSSAMVLWDLERKKVHSVIDSAHSGEISTVSALSGLPLLVSAGFDNSIKVWIFDKADGGCRLLRERRGLTGEAHFLQMYGNNELLVGAASGVGKVSLIQNQQNLIFSQNALEKHTPGDKSRMPWIFRGLSSLPTLTGISFSKIRHFDWPAIVSCHKGLPDAYVWSAFQGALVNRMLIVPRKTGNLNSTITAVAASQCGNYAVVGTEGGELHRFNPQSCQYRGLVGKMNDRVRQVEWINNREIVVAGIDSLTRFRVVPVAQSVRSFDSVENRHIEKFAISGFFCALALKLGGVAVIDLANDREVRFFKTLFPVTSLTWSNDGRLLVAGALDSTATVWDFAGGFVRDRMQFRSPINSCCFSNNDAYLLTTHSHTSKIGAVHAWQNLALLDRHRPAAPAEPVRVDGLEISSEISNVPIATSGTVSSFEDNPVRFAPLPVDGEEISRLITLSGVPRTQLQTLLHLDDIRERNTFSKGVSKPKAVPFFLPTAQEGGKTVFTSSGLEEAAIGELEVVPARQRAKAAEIVEKSEKYLRNEEFDNLLNHLKDQTASGVYLCLAELDGDLIQQAVKFFTQMIVNGSQADLVQTWLAVYLKIHSDDLIGVEGVKELAEILKRKDDRITALGNKVLCFSKVLGAVQLLG